MYKIPSEKVKALAKILALMWSDRKRYLAITYRYCMDTPISDVKYILDKSYQKTKNSINRAYKTYDIELLCELPEYTITHEVKEAFKEVNGRWKCRWCGRLVSKRGRTQHLLKYHSWELEEEARKFLLLIGWKK